jgi:hypothetical protein
MMDDGAVDVVGQDTAHTAHESRRRHFFLLWTRVPIDYLRAAVCYVIGVGHFDSYTIPQTFVCAAITGRIGLHGNPGFWSGSGEGRYRREMQSASFRLAELAEHAWNRKRM